MTSSPNSLRRLVLLSCLLFVGCDDASSDLPTPDSGEATDAAPGTTSDREDAAAGAADSSGASSAPLLWPPFKSTESYAGRVTEEWAEEWQRWQLSQTSCTSAFTDADGSLCSLHQSRESPVFHLATGDYGTMRTLCRIPRDKAILVPLTTFLADGLSSLLGITVEKDQLGSQARQVLDSMRDLTLTIDDAQVDNLEDYVVQPRRLSADVPQDPNYYSCTYELYDVDRRLEDIYFTGYFILLPPPSIGTHVITFGGTQTFEGWDFVNHVRVVVVVD